MPADGCSAGCPSTDRLAGPGPIRGRSGLLGVFCKIMSHQHAPPQWVALTRTEQKQAAALICDRAPTSSHPGYM